MIIGLVYAYLPFMVLPLYAVLERQDDSLLEAAADLGCTATRAFWRVTFPLSLPGVAAGALLCFIPMVGEFVIPDLLGGSDTLMLGRTIWTEFFADRDWPAASAVAIVLLADPGDADPAVPAPAGEGAAVRAAPELFNRPAWPWVSSSSTCPSSCWWSIRSTPAGWSPSGAASPPAGTRALAA